VSDEKLTELERRLERRMDEKLAEYRKASGDRHVATRDEVMAKLEHAQTDREQFRNRVLARLDEQDEDIREQNKILKAIMTAGEETRDAAKQVRDFVTRKDEREKMLKSSGELAASIGKFVGAVTLIGGAIYAVLKAAAAWLKNSPPP
jgi:aminopeptidase N